MKKTVILFFSFLLLSLALNAKIVTYDDEYHTSQYVPAK